MWAKSREMNGLSAYSSLDFVRDNPGELIPEGTFCHLLDETTAGGK